MLMHNSESLPLIPGYLGDLSILDGVGVSAMESTQEQEPKERPMARAGPSVQGSSIILGHCYPTLLGKTER